MVSTTRAHVNHSQAKPDFNTKIRIFEFVLVEVFLSLSQLVGVVLLLLLQQLNLFYFLIQLFLDFFLLLLGLGHLFNFLFLLLLKLVFRQLLNVSFFFQFGPLFP